MVSVATQFSEQKTLSLLFIVNCANSIFNLFLVYRMFFDCYCEQDQNEKTTIIPDFSKLF